MLSHEEHVALALPDQLATQETDLYGYYDVFARQIVAFGQPGDLLIAYSTSGESENLVRAAAAGHQCLMKVVAITGDRHSQLESAADVTIRVPIVDTAVVQELHMLVTHILCDIAESELASRDYAMGEGDADI